MSDPRLVTVATFANAAEASLSKNHLEELGIQAFVGHEASPTIYGLSHPAPEPVSLQVAEEDAESAREYLTRLRKQERPAAKGGAEDDSILTVREREAERVFRCAVFGVGFWPLQLYTFFLLVCVVLAKERLQGSPRRHAIWAGCILGVFAGAVLGLFGIMFIEPSDAFLMRNMARPASLAGKWVGKGADKEGDFPVKLELKRDGQFTYKTDEADYGGIWGYEIPQLHTRFTTINAGASSVRGRLVVWDVERCTDTELALRAGPTKLQLIRQPGPLPAM